MNDNFQNSIMAEGSQAHFDASKAGNNHVCNWTVDHVI